MVRGKLREKNARWKIDKYSRWLGIITGSVEYNNTFDNSSESMCVAGQ